MAIDTEQKRRSSCFQVIPFFYGAILPDGTISATDRQVEAFIYSGIAAASPGGGRIMSSLVSYGGLAGHGGLAGPGGGLAG